jgi:hypothetical protein
MNKIYLAVGKKSTVKEPTNKQKTNKILYFKILKNEFFLNILDENQNFAQKLFS